MSVKKYSVEDLLIAGIIVSAFTAIGLLFIFRDSIQLRPAAEVMQEAKVDDAKSDTPAKYALRKITPEREKAVMKTPAQEGIKAEPE